MEHALQKFILFIGILLGFGMIAAYAIPALATSFGDDVAVSKRLILNSSNNGNLNPDQFQIFSGDTPLVRLHQEPGQFTEQIWDIQGNESAIYFFDITGNKYPFLVNTGAPTGSLWVNNIGNVGIGTMNPLSKLDINEPTAANVAAALLARGGNAFNADIFFGVKNSGGANAGASIGSDGALGGGLSLAGDTGGSGKPHVYISPTGNVGIGTTGPVEKLTINASDDTRLSITRGGVANVLLGDPGSTNGGALVLYNGSGTLTTYINSVGDSYIQGGNVGIGTTNPGTKLEVNGALRVIPAGAPASPTRGTIYFDAASNHFFGFNGVWKQLDN